MQNSSFYRPSPPNPWRQNVPVTKALVGLLLLTSVAAAICQRRFGFAPELLAFNGNLILRGEIWRLVTYVFIESQGAFSLCFSALVVYLFGSQYEGLWGSRDFLRFFVLSTVGAAALAIPLSAVCNLVLPFDDFALSQGPSAVIDAMLMATALRAPQTRVLFGFILPMRIDTMIYALLGINLIGGMMSGTANFSVTLGGMAMGWILVRGVWRPSVWLAFLRRTKRRNPGHLPVVRPKHKRDYN